MKLRAKTLGKISGRIASAASGSALRRAVAQAGLPRGVVEIDFSSASSGNFINAGTGGGTMDANGSPTYNVAFPSTVGGTGVQFGTIASDYFEMSASSIGDATAGISVAGFVTFSSSTITAANSNLVCKRNTSTGAGVELRLGSDGKPHLTFEDDGGTTQSLLGSVDCCDGNDNWVGFLVDFTGGNAYKWHNTEAEDTAAINGAIDNVASSVAIRIGRGSNRDAFGATNGIIRHLLWWTGADAEACTEAKFTSLFAALGG